MRLGAYSIVRFSDNVSDQRVNLGVVVWHPFDGIKFKLSPTLNRIQSVDPRVKISSVRDLLDVIKGELKAYTSEEGPATLNRLAAWFKDGVEVSAPFPAKITSADEMLEHLYEMLVYPVPEIPRASSQRQFERSFEKALKDAIEHIAPQVTFEKLGVRKFGNLSVNVGIRTTGIHGHNKALWHPVSLLSKTRPDEQIALSKATAMDIKIIRQSKNGFSKHDHLVTLQAPRVKDAHSLKDSVDWLNLEADKVIVVRENQDLGNLLKKEIPG